MKATSPILSCCTFSLLAALGLASLYSGRAGGPATQQVDDLIQQLGDKRPKVREAATRRLLELEQVVPALRAALKSPDPEVARRAVWILEELRRRPEQRALARLKEHANNGEVDQAVELFVSRLKWEEENACWQTLTGLAARLIERGRKEFGGMIPRPDEFFPAGDFDRYVKAARPPILVGSSRVWPYAGKQAGEGMGFVLRGTELLVAGGHAPRALIACGGSLRVIYNVPDHLFLSVIYATGPVEMGRLTDSLLICDGDLKAQTISSSLVFVRGDVYCAHDGGVGNSLVIMSGRFHLGKDARIGEKADLRQRQTKFLDFVKFFDPAREGIVVEAAKSGVRVKAVEASKPFAKAGLQVGDVIIAVDKQPTADPEAFRRQLRSALARETFTLQVTRGDESRQVRITAARVSQPPAAQDDPQKKPQK